jgi:hypothetical protein
LLTFALIAAAVAGWSAYVLTLPDAEMMGYFNDDAFYYLVPAHSFAHGQGWTFDLVTRTSGFQVLYGYGSALAAAFTGYTRALPVVMGISSAAALLGAVWLLLRSGSRLYGGAIAAVAVALTFAAPRGFLQITAGLEWGWAVFMTAWFVWTVTRPAPSPASAALAAFLTVLTRIDLSVFVAIYAITIAVSRWQHDSAARSSSLTLVAAAGAGAWAAVALTLINSWLITGVWMPNSVAMKMHWSRVNEFLPAVSWNFIVSSTGTGAVLTSLITEVGIRSFVVMGASLGIAIWTCAAEWRQGTERRALTAASLAAIAAYTIAYARGINMMADHYSAGIVVPLALMTCASLAALGRHWRLAAALWGVGVAITAAMGHWRGNTAHSLIATHAPRLVATVPAESRIAAWNAGIAGWQTGKRVMNLDGLANAGVVEPIRSRTLVCYLAEQRVSHLMDFGFMFPGQIDTSFGSNLPELVETRNGYESAALYGCLTQLAAVDDDAVRGARYRLFAINPGCLATICARVRRSP